MVMKKYLLILIALFLFIPKVNADTLPSFNLVVEKNQNFNLQMFNDRTYLDFFNEIISYDSDYYEILINPVVLDNNSTSYRVELALVTKPDSFPSTRLTYYSSGSNFSIGYDSPLGLYKLYRIFPDINSSVNDSVDYNKFKNCYLNNICFNYSQRNVQSEIYEGINYSSSNNYNNSIYSKNYFFYSSSPIPIVIYPDTGFSSKFSSFSVNNTLIENGDYIPTYYDLIINDYSILLDKDNITNMLVGNITDLYNFRLNLRFFYDNYDYINNMTANYRIYGRKNNTTYYSYEDITSSCSAINGHKLDKDIDTDLKYAQLHYFSQGIACNPNLDLTQYDNFYLDIQTFATSGNYLISYLEYNSSDGNVYFPNSSAYSIYDTFTNLSSDFSLLVTTNYSQRQVNVISDNRYVLGCIVNLYRLSTGGACASPSEIGSLTNLGYMIYKYPEDTSNSVDLSVLTSFDSIISYGSNGTGDNSSYTYYDEAGTITTGVVNNTITLNYNTDNYDVSNYFDIVNNYINDLSTDINEFSTLVQNFYDSAPEFMQITIYVVFILLCCYFVYLMIRK